MLSWCDIRKVIGFSIGRAVILSKRRFSKFDQMVALLLVIMTTTLTIISSIPSIKIAYRR